VGCQTDAVEGDWSSVDRDLLEVDEDEDIVAWSLRLQALAELRALAGADDRPEFPGVIRPAAD
jgi:hypothetical protein